MHRLLLLSVLFHSTAFAADLNGDGCEDVQYAANGACIAETAAVAASVTTTADTHVGAGASVGPFVDLGDVVIGRSATLDGWHAHSSQLLTVGDATVIGRRATIGADHMLGADTTIGRAASAGARLTTGMGTTIGYAAELGSDVTLDDGAVVGPLVDLGNFTHVGPSAVIARNTIVDDAPTLAERSDILGVVGPNVTIGDGVLVSATARVRKDATIGSGAQLMSGARVGRGAFVAAGAVVQGGVPANGHAIAGGTDTVTLGTESMTFRGLPAGTFEMGCKPGRDDDASGVFTDEPDCNNDDWWIEGVQPVTLTNQLWFGETEVTQAQFAAAPGNPTPSHFSPTGGGAGASNGPNPPVENVSWHEAAWFTNWMTTAYNTANGTGLSQCYSCNGSYDPNDSGAPDCTPVPNIYTCDGFRMPTEAEWEYAARGNESHPFAGGFDELTVAWHGWNALGHTESTATLAPNAFGLYDMSGNVWEWTNDWLDEWRHDSTPVTNPLGATSGLGRTIRGGYFINDRYYVRSATRSYDPPETRANYTGFRVCRSIP